MPCNNIQTVVSFSSVNIQDLYPLTTEMESSSLLNIFDI